MVMKFCRDCDGYRPLEAFSKNARSKDGLAFYCREHLSLRAMRSREARRSKPRVQRRPPDGLVVPSGHKWCADCATVRPLDDFVRTRATKSGFGSYCKSCHNLRGKRALDKVGGSRTYHLSRRYGITAGEAEFMLRAQAGVCAICQSAAATQVDHDHETSAVRALLCFNCNGGLGQFRDDPAVLRAAADYVEEHRRRQRPQPLRTRRDEVTVRPGARRRSGWRSLEIRRSPMCTRLQAHLDALART
jgi:hypothetical protein